MNDAQEFQNGLDTLLKNAAETKKIPLVVIIGILECTKDDLIFENLLQVRQQIAQKFAADMAAKFQPEKAKENN